MKTRKLGSLEVSAIGLGCMGFTHGYGTCPSEEESVRLIRKAYEDVLSSTRRKYTVVTRTKSLLEKHSDCSETRW